MLRVLLVEDDPEQSELFEAVVLEAGHQVTLVTNGAEALVAASSRSFDLVLMDITLSGCMTGIEAAARLRVHDPGVRVIFMSAADDGETLERAKLALPVGYLVKPFSPRQLVDALRKQESGMSESSDHDLLVRLDVKLDLVSLQLNEARVQMVGKAETAQLEPRLGKIEQRVESSQKTMYMIVGGLMVVEVLIRVFFK